MHRFTSWLCCAALVLVAFGCGGEPPTALTDGGVDGGYTDAGSTDGGQDAGVVPPPVVTTTALPNALAGADYSVVLTADGGQAPLQWSLVSAGNFNWLSLDPTTGELAGTAQSAGQDIIQVKVEDARQQAASATLSLRVTDCQDGATIACSAPGQTACFNGLRTCANGSFGDCVASSTPSTDPSRCGSSCSFCGATGDRCEDGACACGDGGTACVAGDTCCGGGCADTQTDVHACGSCGNDCTLSPPPHTDAGCVGSACSFACDPAWGSCNDPSGAVDHATDQDGCETDLLNTVSSCGACGNQCPTGPHVTSPSCDNGSCVNNCAAGFLDCDGNVASGCEVDSQTNLANCGACGNACPTTGTNVQGGTCTAGTCGLVCKGTTSDCDGQAANGCEVETASDVANCGACGNACPVEANVTAATCSAGACGVQCQAGYADCDGDVTNGCEVDLTSDPDHCNACNVACPLEPNEATRACVARVCQIGTCQPGYTDCNGLASDGCEKHTSVDVNNCGACGHVCPGTANGSAVCSNGTCGLQCAAGYQLCDGQCVSLNDPQNCGACGQVCNQTDQVCQNGGQCCDRICYGTNNTPPCQVFCP